MSDSVERFPASKLQANGGEITCMVFENSLTGLKRSLFWSLNLHFAPIGEEDCISMTCEWISWKFRHWMQLDGAALSATGDDELIEGSFYVSAHEPMERVSAAIRHVTDNLFELEMQMVVDYQGSAHSDPEPHMLVRGKAVVPFMGMYLKQGISLEEANEFIDISAFELQPSKNEFGMPYYKPELQQPKSL